MAGDVLVKSFAMSLLARPSCGGRPSRMQSFWVQWVSLWD
jgi:hypothetical protein